MVRKIAFGFAGILAFLLLASAALVVPLRWLAPPTSAFMERARTERGAEAVQYHWTPLAAIAPDLAICVLTAEDQRFPEHRGFDLYSIRKALEEDRTRTRGASTLTQQVAKNLYLWPGRSMVRKGLEAWFTVWIEASWPKRRILEVYLNIAEFGPSIFGAGAASEHLFGKRPGDLSLDEAARLAAVLPSPRRMHAARPSEYVRGRTEEIKAAVGQYGDRFRGVLRVARGE